MPRWTSLAVGGSIDHAEIVRVLIERLQPEQVTLVSAQRGESKRKAQALDRHSIHGRRIIYPIVKAKSTHTTYASDGAALE